MHLFLININRGSLHIRSFRRVQLALFKYRLTKISIASPKSFRGFREKGHVRSNCIRKSTGSYKVLLLTLARVTFGVTLENTLPHGALH